MRVVARCAHTSGHRGVDSLVFKFGFVVTGETEVRHLHDQELRVFRRMHIVTRGALPLGNRGMFDLVFEFGLIVATPAQLYSLRKEKLLCFTVLRMRLGMTGDAPAGSYYGMDVFTFHLFFVTRCANRKFLRPDPLRDRQHKQDHGKYD